MFVAYFSLDQESPSPSPISTVSAADGNYDEKYGRLITATMIKILRVFRFPHIPTPKCSIERAGGVSRAPNNELNCEWISGGDI